MSRMFRLIQTDRNVCNHCFRKTHDEWERNYAIEIERDGTMWFRDVDLPNDRMAKQGNVEYVSAERSTRGTHAQCVCGGTKMRPLTKSAFLEHAERLLDRYAEAFDIEIERDLFMAVAEKVKSEPRNQFADDRLYAKITEQVIEQRARVPESIPPKPPARCP